MTLVDILREGADLGLDAIVAGLARHGVTITPDLAQRIVAGVHELLVAGPGVTHAHELLVDDQRTPAS